MGGAQSAVIASVLVFLIVASCGEEETIGTTHADAGMESGVDATIDVSPDVEQPRGTAPERWFAFLTWPADRFHLFASRVVAGKADAAVLVSENLKTWGAEGDAFRWSPSGKQLAFLADLEVADRFDLFVASINASGFDSPTRVNQPGQTTTSVSTYRWSHDGTMLAFVVGAENPVSIYVARFDGSPPFLVSDQAHPFSSPPLEFSEDDSRLAFVASNGDLMTLDVDDQTTSVLQVGAPSYIGLFHWARGAPVLGYTRPPGLNEADQFHWVSFENGTATPPAVFGSIGVDYDWNWVPNGTRLAFKGFDALTFENYGLYVANIQPS